MIIDLATATVAALSPYLATIGTEAVKEVGKETGGGAVKLLGWLREKLTGRGQEALSELEQSPASELNQTDLRTQLAKLLEKQPDLVPQLQALLAETAPATSDAMTQTLGAGAKAIQTKGNNNTSRIG
jgi:hypothetical protein